MVRKKILPFVAVAALALVAVFGALGYRQVFAQAPTPTTAPNTTPPNNGQAAQPGMPQAGPGFRGGFKGGGAFRDGASDADLAAALGITTDKLTAAYTAANTEALKQAVSKGLITQAQADQLAQNAADGRPINLGRFAPGSAASSEIDYHALLAQALGISTDKLSAAFQTAYTTSLDTAVKNGTLTQAEADILKARQALANDTKFQSSLQSAYQAALQQAVTDGVITQAQADQILQSQPAQGAGGFGFGRGFGPGGPDGGFGRGGHGFGRGNNPNQTNPVNPGSPAPTTTAPTSGL